MAIAETITGTVPGGTAFGKFFNHPIMSSGSLMLFDPTHSMGAFGGVPAHLDPIPNVAVEVAAPLLGVSEADARLTAVHDAFGAAPANSIKERSGKGGLVGIYSHAAPNTDVGLSRFGVVGPEAMREYIYNNISHEYFISVWVRMLRAGRGGPSGASAPQAIASSAVNTSSYLFYFSGNNGLNNGTGVRQTGLSTYNADWNVAGGTPALFNAGVLGWSGDAPSGVSSIPLPFFMSGNGGAWGGYNQPGPSLILERAYIEDLTVSGRSYAEVDALDLAQHTAAHAAGGIWDADTFTNPFLLG